METFKAYIDKGISNYRIDPYNMDAYIIDREKISSLTEEDFNNNVAGFYLLVNTKTSQLYVGESSDISRRLKDHEVSNDKKWFTKVFAITCPSFNKSLILYYENRLLNNDELVDWTEWKLENKAKGKSTEDPETNDKFETNNRKNYDDAILKYMEVFKMNLTPNPDFKKETEDKLNTGEYKMTSRKGKYYGTITYSDGQFILKPGAKINGKPNMTYMSKGYEQKINNILNNDKLTKKIDEETYELISEFKYSTPSFIADLISGASLNGWEAFRDSKDTSLQEIREAISKKISKNKT